MKRLTKIIIFLITVLFVSINLLFSMNDSDSNNFEDESDPRVLKLTIIDNDGFGTPTNELWVKTFEVTCRTDKRSKQCYQMNVHNLNPAGNMCEKLEDIIQLRKKNFKNRPEVVLNNELFTFNSETGIYKYKPPYLAYDEEVIIIIEVVDRVCNKTLKVYKITDTEMYEIKQKSK